MSEALIVCTTTTLNAAGTEWVRGTVVVIDVFLKLLQQNLCYSTLKEAYLNNEDF